MLIALTLAAILATEPQPASAAPAAAVAASVALKPGERKVKVVCRSETATGTRFAKRTCLSLEDFKRRQEESRDGFAEMQRNQMMSYKKDNGH
ncbi:MAG: hypothetical protein Q8Q88_09475 [Phenylobacterium sp.]|uniref:hypothetical protein n=1 Tax=Phenylobacterium sp. TaxID=1871053 RepID=UPI0027374FF3|nr:hypothetical protein [Phenylobacterium sp.]MDP3747264.1 hypothetical protein [Phenylobacterium sp.]